MTTGEPPLEEREFKATSAVAIFGAPISWVALFGALIGGMSIIPLLFYPMGGGFMSAGMGIFGPVAGLILGPWAGAVAGTIGGVIGMMISPGAYPLGFVDVILSGTLMPFSWGLFQSKYRKWVLVLFPIHAFLHWFFPYHWPAEAVGLTKATEPLWLLLNAHNFIAVLLFVVGARWVWGMMESGDRKKQIFGLVLQMFMAHRFWSLPWVYPYSYLIRYPYELAVAGYVLGWTNMTIPMVVLTTVIGYFLLRALLKGRLRRVPGGWIDGFDFKFT